MQDYLLFSFIMFGNLVIVIEELFFFFFFFKRQGMGEIDTKSIEPVQVALSLFEEKTDQRKSRPTSSDVSIIKMGFWLYNTSLMTYDRSPW